MHHILHSDVVAYSKRSNTFHHYPRHYNIFHHFLQHYTTFHHYPPHSISLSTLQHVNFYCFRQCPTTYRYTATTFVQYLSISSTPPLPSDIFSLFLNAFYYLQQFSANFHRYPAIFTPLTTIMPLIFRHFLPLSHYFSTNLLRNPQHRAFSKNFRISTFYFLTKWINLVLWDCSVFLLANCDWMKKIVKQLPNERECSTYLCEQFSSLFETNLKERGFVGFGTRKTKKYCQFLEKNGY